MIPRAGWDLIFLALPKDPWGVIATKESREQPGKMTHPVVGNGYALLVIFPSMICALKFGHFSVKCVAELQNQSQLFDGYKLLSLAKKTQSLAGEITCP